jgi:hypothetical protein
MDGSELVHRLLNNRTYSMFSLKNDKLAALAELPKYRSLAIQSIRHVRRRGRRVDFASRAEW